MRPYIESLRTLYKRGSSAVTLTFLQKQLSEKKITQEEYDYIIS